MEAVTLTTEQAAHLAEHGRALVIELVEPQPYPWPHDTDHLTWEPADDYEITGRSEWVMGEMARDGHAPHQLGDVVAISEACAWCGHPLSVVGGEVMVTCRNCDALHDASLTTVTGIRAVRLHDLGGGDFDAACIPSLLFEAVTWWDEQHPDTPWASNPVVWVIELETNHGS